MTRSTATPAHSYPAGTRGLDSITAKRLTAPLPERIRQLAAFGQRFPLTPAEKTAVAEGAPVDVRFFLDGDVIWAEKRD